MPDSNEPRSAADLRAQYHALAAQCTAAQARRKKLRPELEAKIKEAMKIADQDLAALIKRKGEVHAQLTQAQAMEDQVASEQHDIDSADEAAKVASEGLADEPSVVIMQHVDSGDSGGPVGIVTEVIKPEPANPNRRRR